ncbi:Mitochondrial GTPase (Mss1), putative [Penicillium digitatum PHI26]|uniref:Mitochondrial GTPase (Mss1), putative n=2 Tax=Penicillium digitatum TaxID=36651 RepID=K9GAY4_PEND2|nr:Mitochondrial GTPase (Mss1), putative [Penicillium digitatum Pd1]EKV12043.1 Mitochondrial GTPase (Mss1), putative [Penicillium digitatum PHI26]EKV20189.1 Mitochondrial GTPase (Mss1), putative [Penicillium digitatum Pd1]
MLDGDATIYALSTATGRAAIAVVRVSGPACASVCIPQNSTQIHQPTRTNHAIQIYKSLCPNHPLPKSRYAALRTLYDPTQPPTTNTILDAGALVLYFPSPRTATGEDILELHIHGGPAITKAVLSAIAQTNTPDHTVRYAEPGEFTRRAFMNDRLSLPQIEALSDTLSADTEQQRRLAVRGSSNVLLNRYEQWRQGLLYARGELEALIDFSEDQHFDESTEELVSSVARQVRALSVQIGFHIANASRGELLRNGIRVALLGAPNAGKSSLLNRVVGKEAAIVSTELGTTRDIVDVGVDLGGWYCKLGDMAGIRAEGGSSDGETVVIGAVEKEGIRRARERALESDVVIVVVSLENTATGVRLFVEPEVLGAVNDCVEAGKCLVVAINKCDKLPTALESDVPQSVSDTIHDLFPSVPVDRVFAISCEEAKREASLNTTDPGNLQVFLRGLITTFEQIASPLGVDGDGNQDLSYWEDSLGVTHRQSSNLQRCLDHLHDFLSQASSAESPDSSREKELGSLDFHAESEVDIVTAAEHLRFAADMLAKITGKGESGDVEDMLGVIFEK